MTYHSPNRKCFVEPIKKPKKLRPLRICVYDFETSQDTIVREGITSHEVAFVSMRWTCTNCEDKKTNGTCQICLTKWSTSERSKSWSWANCNNPLSEFVNFALYGFKKNNKTLLFAHYGGRFDTHFVLQELYKRRLAPKLIMTGLKIYDMSIRPNSKSSQLHFRDSYLIMQTPLDSLKKTFNLDVEDKMFFPYLYCTRQNINNKLDHLPPQETYSPSTMKPEKHVKFEEWYDKNKETPFNLAKSLAEYCENDTLILLKAVLAMRKIFLKITDGYEVLTNAYSVAGLAMTVYRTLFLKPTTIGIVPEGGYERCDKASDISIKLMEWLSHKRRVKIQHAGNGREYKIENFKVDGYIAEENKVIEFLGIYYL